MTITRVALAAAAAALATGTGTARADGLPPVTFHATGAPQTATVPDDAVAVRIAMTGGSGGSVLHVDGGRGAAVTAYTRVTGGEKLTVDVGAAGKNDGEDYDDQPGGWGYSPGGTGLAPYRDAPGAGGGGSSAVLRGDRPLAVAGGGGGAGASAAPAGSTIATARSAGDGSVTLTWYTSASLTCGDPELQLVDSATPSHTIDAARLCSGTVPIASYDLTSETGTGHFATPDSTDGHLTYEVGRDQTGVGAATVRITDALGNVRTVRLSLLAAPGDQIGLMSHGMAVDALNGDFGREVVAEAPTGAPGQRWRLANAGPGSFYLENAAQGNCLTTTELAERPGAPFELAGCSVAVSNPIRIAPTADATALTLTDAISGLPLVFQSTGAGAPLALGDASDDWTWTPRPSA